MILAAHSIAIPYHPGTVVIATVPFAHPVRARVTGVPLKSRLLHVPGVRSEAAGNERRPTVVEAASRLSGVEDAVQRERPRCGNPFAYRRSRRYPQNHEPRN